MSRRADQKQASRVVQDHLTAERRRRRTIWITVVAVAVLVFGGLIGWGVYESNKPATIAAPAGAVSDGGAQAGLVAAGTGPVRVEVYFDFLCPFCKQFEATVTPTLNQLLTDKKITLVWHPLGFLNSNTRPAGYSTRAGASAGCAADVGRLKDYGEALFTNQPAEGSAGLSDDQLIDIAGTAAGIINPAFAACVRDGKYANWVNHNNDLAAQRGVTATPTVFVAGKLVAPPTAQNVIAAVNAAQ